MQGLEDESNLISRAMSILGKRTSERKKASCKANAKRPRKRSKRLARTKKAVSTPPNGLDATVKNN